MTNPPSCTFVGDRDEALVDYLYGEADRSARRAFETHLERCRVCRLEVEALGGVREALGQWSPPEPRRALDAIGTKVGPRLSAPPAETPAPPRTGWRDVPVWAQVAAAVLCVGVAAGAANLRVTYGAEGLTVSTGWSRRDVASPPPASPESAASPWRSELTALERQLRAEIQEAAAPVSTQAPDAATSEALVRQVRTLISQSEQRQQRELALRIGDALNDINVQRRADLSRIDRTIGLIQNDTGMEVMRQREMLNSLAVRVSSQR